MTLLFRSGKGGSMQKEIENKPEVKVPLERVTPLKKGELKVFFDPDEVENDIVVMMPPKSRRRVTVQVVAIRKAEPNVVYDATEDLDS